jgi:hypothetical protein
LDPRAQARANAVIAALERFERSALSDFAQREALTAAVTALADFNDARAVDRLLNLDARLAGWALIKSALAMCRRGTILPGRRLATALEPFLSKHEDPRNGANNGSWWIVMDALSVLLASDEPMRAIERMRRIPGLQAQSSRFHDLCNLLSTSLLPEAGAYLAELIGAAGYTDSDVSREIEALARSNHPACHARILGLVMRHTSTRPADVSARLRRSSVDLGRSYPAFRADLISTFLSAESDLATYLATILAEIGTDETAEALLCYCDYRICEPVFRQMVDKMINVEIPIEGYVGSYRIVPHEATVFKRHLGALLISDTPIRATACRLLASIRAKRLVGGYPANEPLHPDIEILHFLKVPWPLCN